MGKIVERQVVERKLVLTKEDIEKRRKRADLQEDLETNPQFTPWESNFLLRLPACPVCGKQPHLLKVSAFDDAPPDYKVVCWIHRGAYLLNCGDWFTSLAKAGRDWNRRVREQVERDGKKVHDDGRRAETAQHCPRHGDPSQ